MESLHSNARGIMPSASTIVKAANDLSQGVESSGTVSNTIIPDGTVVYTDPINFLRQLVKPEGIRAKFGLSLSQLN